MNIARPFCTAKVFACLMHLSITGKYILAIVVWGQLNSIRRATSLNNHNRCIYRMQRLHVVQLWFALGFNVGLMKVINGVGLLTYAPCADQEPSNHAAKRTNCGERLLGFIMAQYCSRSPQKSFLLRLPKMDFWRDGSINLDIESGALFTNNVWFNSVHLFSKSVWYAQNCL